MIQEQLIEVLITGGMDINNATRRARILIQKEEAKARAVKEELNEVELEGRPIGAQEGVPVPPGPVSSVDVAAALHQPTPMGVP